MKTKATQHGDSSSNYKPLKFHPLTGDRHCFDLNGLHAKSLRQALFNRHNPTPWRRSRTAGQAVSTGNDIGFPIMQEPDAGVEYLFPSDTAEPNEPTMRPETMDGPIQDE